MSTRDLDELLGQPECLALLFTAAKDVLRSVRKVAHGLLSLLTISLPFALLLSRFSPTVLLGLLCRESSVHIAPFLHGTILEILSLLQVSPSQRHIMLLANVAHVSPSIVRLNSRAIAMVTSFLLATVVSM